MFTVSANISASSDVSVNLIPDDHQLSPIDETEKRLNCS